MNDLKITVVIPVYNTMDYLPACVNALKMQTFDSWEAILVDDGSTDSCGSFCDALAAEDPRFRVVHKENGGLARARLTGLEHARGEAITFYDSDDLIPPNFLEELWNAFDGHDLAICDAEEHDLNGNINPIRSQWPQGSGTVAEYIRTFLYAEIPSLLVLCCWNKLYRTELLRQCPQEGLWLRRCEDTVLNMNFLRYVRTVGATGKTVYYYQRRETSLTGSFKPDVIEGQDMQLALLKKLLSHHGLDKDKELCLHHSMYRMNAFFFAVYQITDAQLGRKHTVQYLDELLKRRIICGADIAAARPHTLPWRLLRLVTALKSGLGMLVWLVLAGKLHWN